MMIRNILTFLIASTLSLSSSMEAAERSFAIIVDNNTYNACSAEIDSYKAMLEREGLRAFILNRDWEKPDNVKQELISLYNSESLEGAIFIGNIPIPMVRDAQHMTSAFKMDQQRYPYDQSSVPSDRFYDDFDLKFDYLHQDSAKRQFHYYSLRHDSPQKIDCDIYTGRLKPTKEGEEGYKQIRDYFRKLIAQREGSNKLDVIVSYTGEGSFSNSLTAWKEDGVIMREQFPQAFSNKNSSKFLIFHMYPFMKQTVTEELRRDDVDLFLFHEHGMPERQYLTAIPQSKGTDENYEAAKKVFRYRLRRNGAGSEANIKLTESWKEYYKIDSTWFAGAFDKEQAAKDSVEDANTGILLADVPVINPNARVVIFDACYNGDFRENSFIAGEYVFAAGKTLVAIGNSVNVLQDKSSSDLLGMLGLGYRVGEWAQLTNILESHIIGDPTFVFTSSSNDKKLDLKNESTAYWMDVLNKKSHPDIKGLALHKLFKLNYSRLQDLLLETYSNSPSAMLRLQVFHLLQHYNDGSFEKLLKESVYDPYEFIRRKSTYAMGRTGDDEFIPLIASIWINDGLDERVRFNAEFSFDLVNIEKLEKEVLSQIESSTSIYDKEKTKADFKSKIESKKRIFQMGKDISDGKVALKTRLMGVSTLRNNNYHTIADDLLNVLSNPEEDLSLRIKLAEALGWFTLSNRRADIITECRELAASRNTDEKLKRELVKTAHRLEVFTRK